MHTDTTTFVHDLIVRDGIDAVMSAYAFLISIDFFVLVVLNGTLFFLCECSVFPKRGAGSWARVIGVLAAIAFTLYVYVPHSLGITLTQAILVGLVTRLVVLLVVVTFPHLWVHCVHTPWRRVKKALHTMWKAGWLAIDHTHRRYRSWWHRRYGPKPITHEEWLRESVAAASKEYETRSAMLDDAGLTQLESTIAKQTLRQALLRRLYELLG